MKPASTAEAMHFPHSSATKKATLSRPPNASPAEHQFTEATPSTSNSTDSNASTSRENYPADECFLLVGPADGLIGLAATEITA